MLGLKRNKERVFYSWFFALILLFFTVVIVIGLPSLVKKKQESKQNKRIAAEELKRIKERMENIGEKQDKLLTEIGQEELIREKFSFKKPGEWEVIIVEDKNQPANAIGSESGFWKFLKGLFR